MPGQTSLQLLKGVTQFGLERGHKPSCSPFHIICRKLDSDFRLSIHPTPRYIHVPVGNLTHTLMLGQGKNELHMDSPLPVCGKHIPPLKITYHGSFVCSSTSVYSVRCWCLQKGGMKFKLGSGADDWLEPNPSLLICIIFIVCGIVWLLIFVDSPEKACMKSEWAWRVQKSPHPLPSTCKDVLY